MMTSDFSSFICPLSHWKGTMNVDDVTEFVQIVKTMMSFRWTFLFYSYGFLLVGQSISFVESVKTTSRLTSRQMCSRLQSMLSYGKYQTIQISSNITYVPRLYSQNFLAYSAIDDLLVFIEPKHSVHVYNAQTIQLLVNFSTTNIVIGSSCESLSAGSGHDLFLIYETYTETHLIQLRVCQVRFSFIQLTFEQIYCIENIVIPYDQSELRIYGFTIKRNHAGTNHSLLFVSTEIGLIYTIFNTRTGVLLSEVMMFNETLNQGSVALSSSGAVYYANREENMLYELHVTRDFRLRYGKTIKTKAIKNPFGLITDECNHLYIATRSMILIMYVQTYATIRSVFSKASDLPISLERLNSTTYVYATMKRPANNAPTYWMFNFLYFTNPDKNFPATRHPAINWDETLDFNDMSSEHVRIPTLWPIAQTLSPKTTANTTKMFTYLTLSTKKPVSLSPNKTEQSTYPTNSIEIDVPEPDLNEDYDNVNRNDENEHDRDKVRHLTDSEENLLADEDVLSYLQGKGNLPPHQLIKVQTLLNKYVGENRSILNEYLRDNRKSIEPPVQITDDPRFEEELFRDISSMFDIPEDDIRSYLEGQSDLSPTQQVQIQTYLVKHFPHDQNILNKYFRPTKHPIDPSRSTTLTSEELEMEENLIKQIMSITQITEEEIRSYLHGRTTLSPVQQLQIQTYLIRRYHTNQTILNRYVPGARRPVHQFGSDDASTTDQYVPLEPIDRPMGISDDDIRLYLEERSNLSTIQKEQIQKYLDRQVAIDPTVLEKYFSPDENPLDSNFLDKTLDDRLVQRIAGATGLSKDEIQSYLQGKSDLPIDQQQRIQTSLTDQLAEDPNIVNRYFSTTQKPNVSSSPSTTLPDGISQDDILAYIEGRSKLPISQQLQIQTYLADQAAEGSQIEKSIDDLTEILSHTINLPKDEIRSYLQGKSKLPIDQKEQIQAELDKELIKNPNVLNRLFPSIQQPTDSKQFYFNRFPTTEQTSTVAPPDPEEDLTKEIGEDDIIDYLEGRPDISSGRKLQIESYLNDLASKDPTMLSEYLKNIQRPPDEVKDLYPNDHLEDIAKKFGISVDEIQLYLEGKSDLPVHQQLQIQIYLAKQSTNDPIPFERPSSTTSRTITTSLPMDFLPPGITKDDFLSFLQGQSNLSMPEQVRMQHFLVESVRDDPNFLNKYFPQTKQPIDDTTSSEDNLAEDIARRLNINEEDVRLYLEGKSKLPIAEQQKIQASIGTQTAKDPSVVSRYFQSTQKPASPTEPTISFPNSVRDDDLIAYVQGRLNLSVQDQMRMQTILVDKVKDDPTFFEKYAPTTEQPIDDGTRPDSTLVEDIARNLDMDEDDVRAYLEGKSNLPIDEQNKIQQTLSKELLKDPTVLSRYFQTTRTPVSSTVASIVLPAGISEDDLMLYLQGRSNLPITDQVRIRNFLINKTKEDPDSLKKYFPHTDDESADKEDPTDEMSRDLNINKEQIRSYLEGKSNLSDVKQQKIQQALSKQIIKDPTILNRLFQMTQKPTEFSPSTTVLPVDIPDDDVISYLEGRSNLTLAQQVQIQRFLAEKMKNDSGSLNKYFSQTTSNNDETIRPTEYLEQQLARHTNLTEDMIRSYLQGKSTLPIDQQELIQRSLTKQINNDPTILTQYLQSTRKPTGSPQTDPSLSLDISEDDLVSFLQGRSNLSVSEQQKIQTFIVEKEKDDPTFLNKYILPTENLIRDIAQNLNIDEEDVRLYLEGKSTLSDAEQQKIQQALTKELAKDPTILNRHIESTQKPIDPTTPDVILPPEITDADIRTYFQDRSNLSDSQQAQIQTYLEKQISKNSTMLNKYLFHSRTPFENTTQVPPQVSKEIALAINMTEEQVRAYLEGRSNLSISEQHQIQTFLIKQIGRNSTTISQLFQTTKTPSNSSTLDFVLPVGITEDDIHNYFQGQSNLSLTQQIQLQTYLTKKTSQDPTWFHKYVPGTTQPSDSDSLPVEDLAKQLAHSTNFTEETIRSYLQGNSTLPADQQRLIQALLHKRISDDPTVLTRYLQSTRKPVDTSRIDEEVILSYVQGRSNLSVSDQQRMQHFISEKTKQDPQFLHKYISQSEKPTDDQTRPDSTLVEDIARNLDMAEDDVRAYLEGKSNLPIDEQNKIQQTLSKEFLKDPTVLSRYFQTTRKPVSSTVASIVLPAGISEDDLMLYLQGRSNLSTTDQMRIQSYLTKEVSKNSTVLNKFFSTMHQPTDKDPTSPNDIVEEIARQLNINKDDVQSYLQGKSNLSNADQQKVQQSLSKQIARDPTILTQIFQTTTKSTPVDEHWSKKIAKTLNITENDIRSFLRGLSNLTSTQQKQVKDYLAKQSSTDSQIFFKYFTSTKRSITIPMFSKDEDQFLLDEIFNGTNQTGTVPFSIDDLKNYLSGNQNLTIDQKTQIEDYLGQQSLSKDQLLSRLDEINQRKPIDSVEMTESEEIFFSNENVRTFLEGQGNLSSTELIKIQEFLAKHPSTDLESLNRYVKTTKTPIDRNTSMTTEKIREYFDGKRNLSISEKLQMQSYLIQQSSEDPQGILAYLNSTGKISVGNTKTNGTTPMIQNLFKQIFTEDEIQSYLTGRGNLSVTDQSKFQSFFSQQSTSTVKPTKTLTDSDEILFSEDNIRSYLSKQKNLTDDQQERIRDFLDHLSPNSNVDVVTEYFQRKKTSSTQRTPVDRHSSQSSVRSDWSNQQKFLSTVSSTGRSSQNETKISTQKPKIITNQTSMIDNVDHDDDYEGNSDGLDDDASTEPSKYPSRFSTPSDSNDDKPEDSKSKPSRTTKPSRTSGKSHSSLVDVHQSSRHTSPSLSPDSRTPSTPSSHRSPSTSPTKVRSSSSKFISESTKTFTSFSSESNEVVSSTDPIESHEISSSTSTTTSAFEIIETTTNMNLSPSTIRTVQSSSTVSESSTSVAENLFTSAIESTNFVSTRRHISTDNENLSSSKTSSSFSTLESSTVATDRHISSRVSVHHHPSTRDPHVSTDHRIPFVSSPTPSSTPHYRSSTLNPIITTSIRQRSRKQKIIRWQTQSSTVSNIPITSSIISFDQTSTPDGSSLFTSIIPMLTSSTNYPIPLLLHDQPTIVITPTRISNTTNTLLTTDILNQFLRVRNNTDSSTNSSEKSIFFNLTSLPASSWNLSFQTNETLELNFALPMNSNETSQITLTNIEANRVETNIVGLPLRVQVDQIQTHKFALNVNASDTSSNPNRTNRSVSDVVIGHVKSTEFEMKLTKSDNMNVYVKEVETETADLSFDNQFCSNESNLEINLKLSKSGTIRYGNRTPIHIGPVFARLHMLQHSCGRDQPLTLFFDICQQENPCVNGGTCTPVVPDFNDTSYSSMEIAHVGYRCECSSLTAGEHCQYLVYPLGFCMNNGELLQFIDRFNQTIQRCLCPHGFRGEHCEENIDNCLNIHCSDHGICHDGIDNYHCSCFDGFYGANCEKSKAQTVLINVARRSFGIVAILLILSIVCLVIVSDIHTYLTRKHEETCIFNQLPRVTSGLFENSVLLLGFPNAPIEMMDLSITRNRLRGIQRARPKRRRYSRPYRQRTSGYRPLSATRSLNRN